MPFLRRLLSCSSGRRPGAAGDEVGNVWGSGNAEQEVGDVEEKGDSHHDDPGHHEADISLKYRISWIRNIGPHIWCKIYIFKKNR